MPIDQDFDGYPGAHFDEQPLRARPSLAGGWWIAAVASVAALVGMIALLSGWPSAVKLQAAQDRGRAEAQVDAAPGARLAAIDAARLTQAATVSKAKATETAAQAGALSADAAAHGASATAPAPAPR